MKFKELEILDVKNTKESGRIKVVFEVPGDKFDQPYPERLTHTFPKKESYMKKMDDGEKRFEHILRKLYIEKDKDKEERKKIDDKLDKIKKESQNKKIS